MKKHFSKWMALVLALTMLCLCLGACGEPDTPVTDPAASTGKPTDKPADTTGSTQPSSEPITITFWHTYGDSEEAQFRDVVLPLWEKPTRTSMWRPSGRTAASTIR